MKVIFLTVESASTYKNKVQFSHSFVSDSLWPHELQHARPPCPSPTPGVHSDSRPFSQWCHPAISSSVIPFSSCPQSLPASELETKWVIYRKVISCNFLVNLKVSLKHCRDGGKWGCFSTVVLVSKAGHGTQTCKRQVFQGGNPSSPDLDSTLGKLFNLSAL